MNIEVVDRVEAKDHYYILDFQEYELGNTMGTLKTKQGSKCAKV